MRTRAPSAAGGQAVRVRAGLVAAAAMLVWAGCAAAQARAHRLGVWLHDRRRTVARLACGACCLVALPAGASARHARAPTSTAKAAASGWSKPRAIAGAAGHLLSGGAVQSGWRGRDSLGSVASGAPPPTMVAPLVADRPLAGRRRPARRSSWCRWACSRPTVLIAPSRCLTGTPGQVQVVTSRCRQGRWRRSR